MQTPEYPDGCRKAVKRDEEAHAEAERAAEEEVALYERVEVAESRVMELEKCIKAMVEVPKTMLACSKGKHDAYREACRYASARLKEWAGVYTVEV